MEHKQRTIEGGEMDRVEIRRHREGEIEWKLGDVGVLTMQLRMHADVPMIQQRMHADATRR